MQVETHKVITFHGKPRGGWSSLDKLQKLVKKEWDLELQEPTDGDQRRMWIELEPDREIDFGRFAELVEEAEKHGAIEDKKYAKEDKIRQTQEDRFDKKNPNARVRWALGTQLLDDVAVKGEVIFVDLDRENSFIK